MIEKVTEDSSVKIRSMILDILFPAKDYINKKSQTTFDRNNDIIINNKYKEEEEEEKEEEEEEEETKK